MIGVLLACPGRRETLPSPRAVWCCSCPAHPSCWHTDGFDVGKGSKREELNAAATLPLPLLLPCLQPTPPILPAFCPLLAVGVHQHRAADLREDPEWRVRRVQRVIWHQGWLWGRRPRRGGRHHPARGGGTRAAQQHLLLTARWSMCAWVPSSGNCTGATGWESCPFSSPFVL